MYKERLGSRSDASTPAQELIQRLQQCGSPGAIVGSELCDGVDGEIANTRIESDPQQIAIRPKLVVRHHRRLATQHRRTKQGIARLLEPVCDRDLPDTDRRDTDRSPSPRRRVNAPQPLEYLGEIGGR